MQQTCTQCGSVISMGSQFCTNCGATQAPAQAYTGQSWQTPPAQYPGQVPPWAQAQGGIYQQQQYQQQPMGGMNNPNAGGFGGPGNAQVNNLLKIAGFALLGGVLLFIFCVALAIVIPIPSVQAFFWIVAVLLIIIPWAIYRRIRRTIRRTMGGFWRFF